MILPADLETVTLLGTTNVAANTSKVDNVIASSGLTTRYRLWVVRFGMRQSAVASTINGYVRANGSAVRRIYLGAGSTMPPDSQWIPGGLRFDANTGLDIETFCSAAAEQYRVTYMYTVEGLQ